MGMKLGHDYFIGIHENYVVMSSWGNKYTFSFSMLSFFLFKNKIISDIYIYIYIR